MKKLVFTFLFIGFSGIYSQNVSFDEKTFFENLRTSYYSLESTDIKNISALVTNLTTESFAKQEWKNPEIFPLQLIWLSPDRMFLSQQGVPSLSDSSKKSYSALVNNLKSQITDILFDLKRFYFSDIYSHISENYKVVSSEDIVQVTFHSLIDTDTTFYEYFFGLNGLCLRIVAFTPSTNVTVETIPYYKTSKTKWIVSGWEVKMYANNEINTGYFVELKFKEKDNIWIPSDIILSVQRISEVGKTFNEVLMFRNFLFNQSLHYIEQ